MRKLPLIFSFILLSCLASVPQAFSAPVEQQRYFTVNIVGGSAQIIEPPFSLQIVEKYGDSIIRDYTLLADTNPDKFNVAWFVPNYKEGTLIEIIATKNGYSQSEKFSYVINENTPKSGELFDHTFILEKLNEAFGEVHTYSEQILFEDKEFIVSILSTSELVKVTLDQPLKKVIIDIEETTSEGSVNITMPKALISGPFIVSRDGIILHSAMTSENATHSSISLQYGRGAHLIEVTGTTIVPEFPIWLVGLTLAIVMAATLAFGRMKLRPRSTA